MKMLRKVTYQILRKERHCLQLNVRTSSLFINGAKATETFAFVTPHIDFPEQIKQKDAIAENLKRRKSDMNLDKIEALWFVYQEVKKRAVELDQKKTELSHRINELMKSDPEGEELKKSKNFINLIKDIKRKIKTPLWSSEEAAIVEILKLPNVIHPLTPDGQIKILYKHLSLPQGKKDHLQIGKQLNLLHFKKNENYYLRNDAAIFELGAKFYFSKELKKNNFKQFSNPDFVKSVVVEGCGEDHTNPNATFILHHNEESKVNVDNRLHLTGGASLFSFFAYHAKNVIHSKSFPLKYYTMGRQYMPAPSDEDSLFHVSQASVVQFFGATKNVGDLDAVLNECVDILKHIYSNLGYHFRIAVIPADKLYMWESLRIVIEMYSTSLGKYVEVANVSVSEDFISKRLLFTYTEDKQTLFPHVISGTLLNAPKLLGCVLEQDDNFKVPEQFRVENWSEVASMEI